jgi:hypothetical protein
MRYWAVVDWVWKEPGLTEISFICESPTNPMDQTASWGASVRLHRRNVTCL